MALVAGEGPYWDLVIDGAREAAEQYDVNLTVIRSKPDEPTQSQTIRDLIGKKYNGVAVSPIDPMAQAVMPAVEAYEWFTKTSADRAPNWKNEMTARSLELASEYEPGSYISRIAPTPLLMIVAAGDTVTPFEHALEAYEQAREPKQIIVIQGGHFDAYTGSGFDECSAAARDHFVKHLHV